MIAQDIQGIINAYDCLQVSGGADKVIDERTQYKASEWVKTQMEEPIEGLRKLVNDSSSR